VMYNSFKKLILTFDITNIVFPNGSMQVDVRRQAKRLTGSANRTARFNINMSMNYTTTHNFYDFIIWI